MTHSFEMYWLCILYDVCLWEFSDIFIVVSWVMCFGRKTTEVVFITLHLRVHSINMTYCCHLNHPTRVESAGSFPWEVTPLFSDCTLWKWVYALSTPKKCEFVLSLPCAYFHRLLVILSQGKLTLIPHLFIDLFMSALIMNILYFIYAVHIFQLWP